MSPEAKFQSGLVKALTQMHIWAISNVVTLQNRGPFKRVTGLGKGSPDVLAIFPGGQHVWFELKTKDGVLSEGQKVWHARALEFGVTVHVVRSVEEAVAVAMQVWRQALVERTRPTPGNTPGNETAGAYPARPLTSPGCGAG